MEAREAFEAQICSVGLPLADGSGLSVEEKIHLLAEVCGDEALGFPGMFALAMMAAVRLHHQGLLACGTFTKEALSGADRERLGRWGQWCRSAEKVAAEAYLMDQRLKASGKDGDA